MRRDLSVRIKTEIPVKGHLASLSRTIFRIGYPGFQSQIHIERVENQTLDNFRHPTPCIFVHGHSRQQSQLVSMFTRIAKYKPVFNNRIFRSELDLRQHHPPNVICQVCAGPIETPRPPPGQVSAIVDVLGTLMS